MSKKSAARPTPHTVLAKAVEKSKVAHIVQVLPKKGAVREVIMKWQEIDPEMADFYLKFNLDHNRPWNADHVNFLAEEMVLGRWKVNGDTIRIDAEGRLIDGQHRLRAIIKAGVKLRMLVIENLEPEVFVTIDTGGKVRSTADVLAINNEKSVRNLTTALTAVWRYEKEDYPAMQLKPSTQALLEFLAGRPEIRDVAGRVKMGTRNTFLGGAAGSLLLYYGRKYSEALEQFWVALQKGTGLLPETGCYWLRERMIRMKTSAAFLPTPALIALTIKAWNSDIVGKPVKQLVWRQDETFPRFA